MPWRRAPSETRQAPEDARKQLEQLCRATRRADGARLSDRIATDRRDGRVGCGRPSASGVRAVRPARSRDDGAACGRATPRRSTTSPRPSGGTCAADGPGARTTGLDRDPQPRRPRPPRALPRAPWRRTTYRDVEVIVVDNGSTDGSADLAESLDAPVPGTGHPERGEPVVLGRQRSGGGDRRRASCCASSTTTSSRSPTTGSATWSRP